jgi:AraC-like DNA-binding protein/uncharacterized cupin superfamily protein
MMKLMHEQINFPDQSIVNVKLQNKPHFTYPWHYHTEYEIIYVIDGFGNRFVGDNIEPFRSGDLVLLGSNLPHFWKSDETFHQPDNNKKVKYVVMHFSNTFFDKTIAGYPEFHRIKELMAQSSRGMHFSREISDEAKGRILKIANSNGLNRLILTLELLQFLSKTDDFRMLAGELYHFRMHEFIDDRLSKVLHYLNSAYLKKIELKKVAAIANLHPSAFCRYFKEKSSKSLSEFVNEMRIGYACRLILEGKMTVSQICFESGFNNLSNFNRTFKRHTGYTPSSYYRVYKNR